MTPKTGNDVTSRFVSHGFLLVFNTRFESIVYRSQLIYAFSAVSSGGLSISAAWGRLKVTSPFDSSTTVFYYCSIHFTCPTCTIRKLYSFFSIVDHGGMSISTARGRLRPEKTPPVDRATMVFVIHVSLTCGVHLLTVSTL
jgi:hypothetical protein